ncbi:MAG: CinA family protein, partial [Bacteroidales bacterium]
TEVLGVDESLINSYGAVSKDVVIAMAERAKNLLKSDYALATSGIAGPDGGTPEKPVGTVWVALATPEYTIAEKLMLGNDRERNIIRASVHAMNMLRKAIV